MITKNDIFAMLSSCGVKKSDAVTIHTSLRAIGPIEGGADGLIDAFCEYLSEGHFLVPTHTWGVVNAQNPLYNVRETVPNIGTLARVAAFRPDAVRSLHPTHSLAVFGKNAEELVVGEEKSQTPCPPGGLLDRLYEREGKVLLIGVGHERNTYLHAVDERYGIKNRLNPESYDLTVVDREGKKHEIRGYRGHKTIGLPICCAAYYPNYEPAFDAYGAVAYAKLGGASVRCCDVKKMTDIVRELWRVSDHDLCFGEEVIPPAYYQNLSL